MAQSSGIEKLFWGGVGLGALYFGAKLYQKHQATQARNMKIKISGVHVENDGTMNMDFQVLNPNSAAFEFKSVVGDLSANGHKLVELKMFGDYTVRPNDQATIPVIARITSMDIFRAAFAKQAGRKIMLVFQGTVNVNDKAVPLTLNYSV